LIPEAKMGDSRKSAGQSTRDMADRRYKARLWFVLGALAVVIVIIAVASNAVSLGIGGFGVLGLLVLGKLVMDFVDVKAGKMQKEERRAVRGARAEEKIGFILDNLGPDYLAIHDVRSPYGNIDHVVISKRGGVFLVETKAHGGRVSVSGGQLLVNGHEPEKDL
jgi:hypothetical protein